MIHRFGDYSLDTKTYALHRSGETVAVEPQVFSVLLHLIENRDRVVSRDELLDAVWGGRIVSDATLSSRINAVRVAVGDTGKDQAVIRTVPRRGFRFVAPMQSGADPVPSGRDSAQDIRYCVTPDGVELAYALTGTGPPCSRSQTG